MYNHTTTGVSVSIDGDLKCNVAPGVTCSFPTTTGKHLFYYSKSDGKRISDNNEVPAAWDELCIDLNEKGVEYDDCDG